jgi:hypothetical protein
LPPQQRGERAASRHALAHCRSDVTNDLGATKRCSGQERSDHVGSRDPLDDPEHCQDRQRRSREASKQTDRIDDGPTLHDDCSDEQGRNDQHGEAAHP